MTKETVKFLHLLCSRKKEFYTLSLPENFLCEKPPDAFLH